MRPSQVLSAIVPLLAAAGVTAKEVRLFHRVFHPNLPEVQYRQRGVVVLGSTGQSSFRPSTSLAQDLSFFAETLQAGNVDLDTALYQVALEPENDASEASYDISVVKVCHLHKVSQETIVLHTNDPRGTVPYALDYFVSPIPHDGACRSTKRAKSNASPGPSPLQTFAGNIDGLNSTVAVRVTHVPPLPELRTPPSLNPQGETVVVQEKTFVQKYWVYISVFLIAALLMPSGEEEEPKGRARQ